ncbi:MAG: macro domain-containing protein [Desulfobulbaceae bacterium]|jgi:O-acetyl-ADP-ribose deacetylase (regulator of RNase III)|nr:macro domain-containing protein [Desulfobulbaceae bacterium]
MEKRTQIGNITVELLLGDISEQEVDAIVNAANRRLAGGGGVDGAIHRLGGPAIMAETRQKYPNGCPTGFAVATGAGNLAAKWVFHTVGPRYRDGLHGEEDALRACYQNCLRLAVEHGCQSIAFPAIATGAYGYPIDEAAIVALQAVRDFQSGENPCPQLVRFVLFSGDDFKVYARALEPEPRREYVGQAKPNTMSVCILADSSGSMAGIADDMSGSLNTLMAENRNLDAEVTVTYSTFSSNYQPQFAEKPIAEVPEFKIVPTNSTALLESAYTMIEEVDARFAALDAYPEKVLFVIVTDGMENASRPQYTRARLFSLIERQTKERNWVFLYFGANQDAIHEAASFGIDASRSMNYCADRHGLERNRERLSRKMEQVMCCQQSALGDVCFDDEDRKE